MNINITNLTSAAVFLFASVSISVEFNDIKNQFKKKHNKANGE